MSKAFAAAGATVVVACRSVDRGEGAREERGSAVPGTDCDVRHCDLADLESVRSFAEGFRSNHDDLDVLRNNAGLMAIPRRETAEGFETQFYDRGAARRLWAVSEELTGVSYDLPAPEPEATA